MTTGDSALTMGAFVLVMLVLPVGALLMGPAWLAYRHGRAGGAFATAIVAALGFAAALWLTFELDRRLAWVAVAFVFPMLAGVFATFERARPIRLALLVGAALPALAIAGVWASDAIF